MLQKLRWRVRSQLYLAFDLDYITKEEFEKLIESV
jgi:hypothetical protein